MYKAGEKLLLYINIARSSLDLGPWTLGFRLWTVDFFEPPAGRNLQEK
jgi:hypothetical protein